MKATLRALWHYRSFILGSVKREFQAKYLNSLLGAAWSVIQPLSMIFVYTVIFSQIMKAKLPGVESTFGYSIYLCAGIIMWGYFSDVVGRGQNIFIDNANLLKKLSFPRFCLPFTLVLSATLNFAIILGLFVVFLLISGNFPGLSFVAIFPILAVQVIFALGLGMVLGVLNVFFRDVGQLFAVVLQFWFWMTPIIYPLSILPPMAQHLMAYNPMAVLIGAYQQVLVHGQWPEWSGLWPVLLVGVLLCLLALRLFRKRYAELMDEL
ncbi:ABC transporter permease [Pseudomonas sp. RC10]|uniref:ABC transporter permease n=1 Tax=Pseudomonas bambusae TaxID=3139142 RepID=UPI00313A36E0